MGKKHNTREADLETLVSKIEEVLGGEISNLPEILQGATPEKRLDFMGKILPEVIKYREKRDGLGGNGLGWI